MEASIDFVVAGARVRLTRTQVLKALRGVTPGPIRTHSVRVGGMNYAVKEALAIATGLDPLDFNTNQARGWLRRLGFEVRRVELTAGRKTRS